MIQLPGGAKALMPPQWRDLGRGCWPGGVPGIQMRHSPICGNWPGGSPSVAAVLGPLWTSGFGPRMTVRVVRLQAVTASTPAMVLANARCMGPPPKGRTKCSISSHVARGGGGAGSGRIDRDDSSEGRADPLARPPCCTTPRSQRGARPGRASGWPRGCRTARRGFGRPRRATRAARRARRGDDPRRQRGPGSCHRRFRRSAPTVSPQDNAPRVTAKGSVAEGTAWNLFWWDGPVLCTPAAELGILPGLGRSRVMELTTVREDQVPVAALAGRSLFLVNAVRGIVAIDSLQGLRGPRDPRTAELSSSFWPD